MKLPSRTGLKKGSFVYQKVADFGAGNPAVARLIVAPHDWLKCFDLSEDRRAEIATLCFEQVGRHAAECFKIAGSAAADMARAEETFAARPTELPSLVNCRTRAEQFLDHAQSCLLESSKFIDLLVTELPCKRNFRAIREHLASKRPDLQARQLIEENRDLLKRVALLRNAARHHGGDDGTLTIRNYSRGPGPSGFTRPTWQLNEETSEDLLHAMQAISEFVTTFGELLLQDCLFDSGAKTQLPLRFALIPPAARDKALPFAFRVEANLGGQWLPFG